MRLQKLRRSVLPAALAAAIACSGAALRAADTFEPNDTRETATPIASGSPLVSYISSSGDVDFYHFSLSSAQHIRIDLIVPAAANYAVALHQEFSAVRDPVEMYVADNPGTGVNERLEWTLEPGNYWIVVRVGSPSPAYDPDGSYTLTLTAPLTGDTFEPNNTIATATCLPLATTISSHKFTLNDADWYRIGITAEAHLLIELDVPDTQDYNLSLYNAAGSLVAGGGIGTSPPGTDKRILMTVAAGTYYVLVGWQAQFMPIENPGGLNYSQDDLYHLTATSGPFTDTFEPNNRIDTARRIGPGSFASKIYTPNDQDWYRFNATGAGTFTIHLDVPASADFAMALYKDDGTYLVGSETAGTGIDEQIVFSANSRAGFRLRIYRSDPSPPGDYTLTLSGSAIRPVYSVPGDFDGNDIADLAIYNQMTGTWSVRNQFTLQHQFTLQYGGPGDLAVPGDYNGDRRADVAVYRPLTGVWSVKDQFVVQFGEPGDIPVAADYNGDGATDIAVYRPSTGFWYVRGQLAVQFGDRGDVPVPGDYNADGATDIAVYRVKTGYWYVRNQSAIQFGGPGDVPVPADYDGNGSIDVAVYRPSTGYWYGRNQFAIQHGIPGDVPVPGDYDGDGAAEVVVFRPATGDWLDWGHFTVHHGDGGYQPVPRAPSALRATAGDYDGDGVTDLAVYRPSTGQWFVRNKLAVQFGDADDVPVPGDYNGDGRQDVAVFRPSTAMWYVRNQFAVQWGSAGDIPVPADYNGDGTTDVARYSPSTGLWFVRNQFVIPFGEPGDIPVPGDYDGDGITDVAIYRPSTATWYVRNQFTAQFGDPGDVPVPGDYNGDGMTDVAVHQPSRGLWDARQNFLLGEFGEPGDVVTPGDFDGDGATDVALYRPGSGTWHVWHVYDAQFESQFGDPGDVPLVRTNGTR